MAGVGVKLNRFFEKKSIAADVLGITYSVVITIAPILMVVVGILLMGSMLEIGQASYLERELFSCTMMYILIFALLVVAPFSAVFSRYMQDVMYEEKFQDILPCYYLGAAMTVALGCLLGIPFCIREHFAGGVDVFYVFISFCAYISMILVFYSVTYLSCCKDYERISLFFFIGMAAAFGVAWVLRFWCHWEITESMLFALMVGFLLIAVLQYTAIKSYFKGNSHNYRPILGYFKKRWYLVVTNFLYVLGLYIHNFVLWTGDGRRVVAESFVFNQSYDMATCLAAVFTNVSATVIFVTHMEMHFHEKYKLYSEAVIGGKKVDIENAKSQMFWQLGNELMNLARVQFIISVVAYLLCIVIAPQYGFAGNVMRIYPCLAAGYFIVFIMYAALLFLYYFSDVSGTIFTVLSFFFVTFAGSIIAMRLPEIWQGMGLVAGALAGWTVAYMRLRWVEKNLDVHIFCQGAIIKRESGQMPSSLVYHKADENEEKENR